MIWKWLAAVVLVETVCSLTAKGEIFDGVRKRLGEGKAKLFSECFLCQSVWAGWGTAFLFSLPLGLGLPWPVERLLAGLIVHRAACVLHEAVDRFLEKEPYILSISNPAADPHGLEPLYRDTFKPIRPTPGEDISKTLR